MANKNPFSLGKYDLEANRGVGSSKEDIDNSLLYSAMDLPIQCYSCTAPNPKYQVVAKQTVHETAQIQNGLYLCNHCMSRGILDSNLYGLRTLYD